VWTADISTQNGYSLGGRVRYFLLEGEHLVPFAELTHLLEAHHAYLQSGYDRGDFLFSGPQVPAHGGFLVARAEDLEALNRLLAEEPFVKAGKMRFSRIVEFEAAQNAPILNAWFDKVPAREH
jgi:uncharacterized protein YciI